MWFFSLFVCASDTRNGPGSRRWGAGGGNAIFVACVVLTSHFLTACGSDLYYLDSNEWVRESQFLLTDEGEKIVREVRHRLPEWPSEDTFYYAFKGSRDTDGNGVMERCFNVYYAVPAKEPRTELGDLRVKYMWRIWLENNEIVEDRLSGPSLYEEATFARDFRGALQ